jgi:hypothetical protein
MTKEEFDAISDDEYLKFSRIPINQRLSTYPDICALLYLEKLLGGSKKGEDMIAGASHDIVCLCIPPESLTKEDAIYLNRCGVHWNSETECLAMFY